MDFAQRAHDHNYRMDPIVRKRSDLDFYKLTMGQVIDQKHPLARVTFEFDNRSKHVRLAEHFSIEELREQLDHARSLRWTPAELIHVQGQTYYGVENMFKPAFVGSLARSRLPDYEVRANSETGQYEFRTEDAWLHSSAWEDHILVVINELYARSQMRKLSKSQLDIMYARAKTRLYAKLERIRERPGIELSEFGTRRRHSFPWQKWVIETMIEVLGKQFVGTSNVLIAQELGIEAKGTNAHEMPMVYAALAARNGDEAIRASQYDVLKDWMSVYGDRLRIALPDTFGTTQFLAGVPEWFQWWSGMRPDSKEAFEAGEEMIAYWKSIGQDPANKLALFCDGLDVALPGVPANGTDIVDLHDRFHGRIMDGYGWGTNATNCFSGCVPGHPEMMAPISAVCKAARVDGHPCVKISDNPAKAKSPDPAELARYLSIFGTEGIGPEKATVV